MIVLAKNYCYRNIKLVAIITLKQAGTKMPQIYLRNKPYGEKAKNDSIICLAIVHRYANMKTLPDVFLPLFQLPCS